jgi:hypothetical protein
MHVVGFIDPGCLGLRSTQEAGIQVLQVVHNLGPGGR